MSIEDLKRFFAFEADEPEHIDDIVALLEDRRAAIEEQRRTLDEAYAKIDSDIAEQVAAAGN